MRGMTPELFYGHDDMPGLRDVFTPYCAAARSSEGDIRQTIRRRCCGRSSAIDADDARGADRAPGGGQDCRSLRDAGPASASHVATGARRADQQGRPSPQVVRVEARADVRASATRRTSPPWSS